MRRLAVALGIVVLTAVPAAAQVVTADLFLNPREGDSTTQVTATYLIEHDGGCPAGEEVSFTWQSQRRQTPLGASRLIQTATLCRTELRTQPPADDRAVGIYPVCGTYRTPQQQSIAACEDFEITAIGAQPGPTGQGTTGTTGGPTAGSGGTGTPAPGGTGSPGSGEGETHAPSPGATTSGEHAAETPKKDEGPKTPIAGGAVGLLLLWGLVHAAGIVKGMGPGH